MLAMNYWKYITKIQLSAKEKNTDNVERDAGRTCGLKKAINECQVKCQIFAQLIYGRLE